MGKYNPTAPHLLGEEWVPIRDEDVVFSPSVNVVELGHGFALETARVIQDVRFYTHQLPATPSNFQTGMMAIYPAGTEALTGPIQSVVIPVNNGGITGTGLTLAGSATSVADALQKPGDSKYISAAYNSGVPQELSMFFAVNQYPQLQGKRILNVSLLYSGYTFNTNAAGDTVPFVNPNLDTPATVLYLMNDSQSQFVVYTYSSQSQTGSLSLATAVDPVSDAADTNQTLNTINLGDVNHFWSTALGPFGTFDRMPWRYLELQRLEASAANRLQVHLTFQVPDTGSGSTINTFVRLQYAALKVTFCEEQRVIYGGQQMRYNHGANIVTMRDTAFAATPTLPVGSYTATMSWVNPGAIDFGRGISGEFPKLNGLRELYAIPTHPGVQVNVPSPLHDGDVFTKQTTHILPQLTVHTSGGPLTEVHVYGRQSVAQVYGTITATQEILDSAAGGATTWPQVRFYARRFGQTTNPLKLDSPTITGAGMSVQITPPEWDALPEILDGWKEITLQFPTPPTMGAGTSPQWRWSSSGENAGNRWEVLGATAPALSGIPGNLQNLVPSPQQLSSATYGAPAVGATINEGWIPQYAPPVTATTDDQTSDAVLIFAQTFPAITGLTVEAASQEVTGIGLDCGIDPCCIPTAINYHSISWSPLNGAAGDTFTRVVAAGGFGTAETGQPWTVTGTASNYSVNGTAGQVLVDTVNSERRAVVDLHATDQYVQAELLTPVLALTATLGQGILLRYADINNYYWIDTQLEHTTNLVTMRLNKRVAGVLTNPVSVTTTQTHSITVPRVVEARITGSTIQVRTWLVDQPKPDAWQMTTTDTSHTTGTNAGVVFRATTANTSGTYTASVDNFLATPIGWGSYELQRMDLYTDWQTIMLATSPGVDSFLDYEARIGMTSTYRVRAVDSYGFNGTWSSEVSITSTAPGISGGCVAEGHILVFTSNEIQAGTSNLAYASVWEDRVSEDLAFAEASFVQLQTMYNRDFFTAFRPTERGGERFQRTVLVQAAAIDPLTLADFTGLRDMAWADTPYVCVRDEDGNRWFATVLVPAGRVRLNRSIYTAQVDIIEVTDTASPVDP